MMDNDKVAAVLINELDSIAHYIEAMPAHPHYTTAANYVREAKAHVSKGRMELQSSGPERFAMNMDASTEWAQSGKPVPPRPAQYVHPPWCVGFGWFKANNIPDEFADLFWTHHSTETYILRPHVVSRGIPRVLQMCYNLDEGNDSWTLCIQNCPSYLRKFYPTLPHSYMPKEWEEGGIRETWYKKLYYWREDESVYRLRHGARGWEDKQHG